MQKTLKQKKCTPFVLTLTKNKGRYTAHLLLHLTQCIDLTNNICFVRSMQNALTFLLSLQCVEPLERDKKIEQYAAQEVARTLTKNQSGI